MTQYIQHCGFVGYITLALVAAGIITTIVMSLKGKRAWLHAAAFAVAVLACGATGFGLGQIMVSKAVQSQLTKNEPKKAIAMVAIGTQEASGNVMVGGLGALLVSMVGGGTALLRRRPERSA